jgi:hypothetical protein
LGLFSFNKAVRGLPSSIHKIVKHQHLSNRLKK